MQVLNLCTQIGKVHRETGELCVGQGILQSCFAMKNSKRKFVILNSLSGVLVPSRFTLLLGPPASGKSTLLKALSNQLRRSSGAKVRAIGGHPALPWKNREKFPPMALK